MDDTYTLAAPSRRADGMTSERLYRRHCCPAPDVGIESIRQRNGDGALIGDTVIVATDDAPGEKRVPSRP